MNSILYIGNKLSHHGFTKGVIETLGPQLVSEGFKVLYAGTKKHALPRLVEMLFSIFRYRNQVVYVLIDTYSTTAFWFAWLSGVLCRILKIKYIHILHGGNIPERLKKSPRACASIFKTSYANVAVSGYLKHAFDLSDFPAVVIPNNIDIARYPFKLRNNPKPKLLWVRSFHRIYNPNMAASVLLNLLKIYPDAELCMVGPDKDGSLTEFRDYAQKIGVLDKIKITGVMTKKAWIKLSEQYDIFINTTNFDNTPVSVIESMALGLPVVSTRVGGIPFLLEDNADGLLTEPGNAYAMTNRIKEIIQNDALAESLSMMGRKKAETFDWEKIKIKWMELLETQAV